MYSEVEPERRKRLSSLSRYHQSSIRLKGQEETKKILKEVSDSGTTRIWYPRLISLDNLLREVSYNERPILHIPVCCILCGIFDFKHP
jgi:hypothetical protein